MLHDTALGLEYALVRVQPDQRSALLSRLDSVVTLNPFHLAFHLILLTVPQLAEARKPLHVRTMDVDLSEK